MKLLLLVLLVLTVSCGNDNKSGDPGLPGIQPSPGNPLPAPSDNLRSQLVGFWAEVGACVDANGGRPNGIKQRFEVRVFPADVFEGTVAIGRIVVGGAEYSNRCERGQELSLRRNTETYRLSPAGLEIETNRGVLRRVDLQVIDARTIIFKGKTLKKLSPSPTA